MLERRVPLARGKLRSLLWLGLSDLLTGDGALSDSEESSGGGLTGAALSEESCRMLMTGACISAPGLRLEFLLTGDCVLGGEL